MIIHRFIKKVKPVVTAAESNKHDTGAVILLHEVKVGITTRAKGVRPRHGVVPGAH